MNVPVDQIKKIVVTYLNTAPGQAPALTEKG